ncbi:MAG: tetratricopeptide repeat protein [Synechococcales cyanobacterium RU_4_20]|nr:tetratricopeptide repeat protein [Synechococcales cyanobacterium RU_4_20]NJR70248.1 tetratricopeptide repeat protein [Synechococcales cyanobacterium CRU_2_2]
MNRFKSFLKFPFKFLCLGALLSLLLWSGLAAPGVTALGVTALGVTAPGAAWAASPSPELEALYRDLGDLYQRAFTATNAGDFVTAEGLWSEAIDRMPNNPATWSNRGNARVSQFKLEEAIADFDHASELAPDQPGPYLNRGTAWEGLRQWERAIADYNRALALDPDDPVALNNRGNAEGARGNWDAAKQDFHRAAELAPGFALASINYALALYQLDEKPEGTRYLRNLVRRYSQAADPRAALTAVLWDQGLQGDAESNWVAAINLDSRYRDLDWVANIRRWPPKLVVALDRFLKLESGGTNLKAG